EASAPTTSPAPCAPPCPDSAAPAASVAGAAVRDSARGRIAPRATRPLLSAASTNIKLEGQPSDSLRSVRRARPQSREDLWIAGSGTSRRSPLDRYLRQIRRIGCPCRTLRRLWRDLINRAGAVRTTQISHTEEAAGRVADELANWKFAIG